MLKVKWYSDDVIIRKWKKERENLWGVIFTVVVKLELLVDYLMIIDFNWHTCTDTGI